jgi:hypothetical protein
MHKDVFFTVSASDRQHLQAIVANPKRSWKHI